MTHRNGSYCVFSPYLLHRLQVWFKFVIKLYLKVIKAIWNTVCGMQKS